MRRIIRWKMCSTNEGEQCCRAKTLVIRWEGGRRNEEFFLNEHRRRGGVSGTTQSQCLVVVSVTLEKTLKLTQTRLRSCLCFGVEWSCVSECRCLGADHFRHWRKGKRENLKQANWKRQENKKRLPKGKEGRRKVDDVGDGSEAQTLFLLADLLGS